MDATLEDELRCRFPDAPPPLAHVISKNRTRYEQARRMLQQAGFHVHRFPPIPTEDAEVGRWAAQYRRADDPKDS